MGDLDWDAISKYFRDRYYNDRQLQTLSAEITKGAGTWNDTHTYSIRVSELVADTLADHGAEFSEWNVEKMITGAMGQQYDLINTICKNVQASIYAGEGVGIAAANADRMDDRVTGIISNLTAASELPADLKEQLVNYGMSVQSSSIANNAGVVNKVGGRARIIRECEPSGTGTSIQVINGRPYIKKYSVPCEWCRQMAGTYDYDDLDNNSDVWKRHAGCRCKITYKDGFKRQTVNNYAVSLSDIKAALRRLYPDDKSIDTYSSRTLRQLYSYQKRKGRIH